ncbi:hypothetical protein ROS217_12081 [Roseovarius sp. 217]|nr:hypothetical protein ROS217_12081 [Roseovarius sp. 217]
MISRLFHIFVTGWIFVQSVGHLAMLMVGHEMVVECHIK